MPDLRLYGATAANERTFYFPFLDPNSDDGDFLQSTPALHADDSTIINDDSTVDSVNMGAYVTGGETIGLVSGVSSLTGVRPGVRPGVR